MRFSRAAGAENFFSGFGHCPVSCMCVLLPSFLISFQTLLLETDSDPQLVHFFGSCLSFTCLQINLSKASSEQTAPLPKPSMIPIALHEQKKNLYLLFKALLEVAPNYFPTHISLLTKSYMLGKLNWFQSSAYTMSFPVSLILLGLTLHLVNLSYPSTSQGPSLFLLNSVKSLPNYCNWYNPFFPSSILFVAFLCNLLFSSSISGICILLLPFLLSCKLFGSLFLFLCFSCWASCSACT